MRATSFTILFPDGDFELDTGTESALPAIGDVINRKRQSWTVIRVSEGDPAMVYVMPVASPEALS